MMKILPTILLCLALSSCYHSKPATGHHNKVPNKPHTAPTQDLSTQTSTAIRNISTVMNDAWFTSTGGI